MTPAIHRTPWFKPFHAQFMPVELTIKAVTHITFRTTGDEKLALELHDRDKKLLLNQTNTRRLVHSLGEDVSSWVGARIIAAPNKTKLGVGWTITVVGEGASPPF